MFGLFQEADIAQSLRPPPQEVDQKLPESHQEKLLESPKDQVEKLGAAPAGAEVVEIEQQVEKQGGKNTDKETEKQDGGDLPQQDPREGKVKEELRTNPTPSTYQRGIFPRLPTLKNRPKVSMYDKHIHRTTCI